jgi:hypothetical protein
MTGRTNHRVVPLLTLALAACGEPTLPLPAADDPAFAGLEQVRLGMRLSEFTLLGRDVETSPEGDLRESFEGVGWITYDFVGGPDPRLSTVQWWTERTDSVSLRRRCELLFIELR